MTRQEFNDRLSSCKVVSDEAYKIIEFVYNHHPIIDPVKGKEQIAMLFDNFGMRIIKDMLPTAERAKELEEKIREARHVMHTLEKELNDLR